MSWIQKLYETYERCANAPQFESEPLLPVSHTEQQAHIEIVLDEAGNFQRAATVRKESTVVPATEPSMRTSPPAAYRSSSRALVITTESAMRVTALAGLPASRLAAPSKPQTRHQEIRRGMGVSIQSPDGMRWIYCHASQLRVALGDQVVVGQLLMLSGNTGHSSGPHLHLGLRINGIDYCPQPFVIAALRSAAPPRPTTERCST